MVRQQKDPLRPLTAEERAALESTARSGRDRADRVMRSKMLLAIADGASFTEAARLVGRRSGDAVAGLVARWNVEGLAALSPRFAGGAVRRLASPEFSGDVTVLDENALGDLSQGHPHPRVDSPANDAASTQARSPQRQRAAIRRRLRKALALAGAQAVALVDTSTGKVIASAGAGIDLRVAAAGNARVVLAKLQVTSALGLADEIEDILITLNAQYHLIRPVQAADVMFLYLVLDRRRTQMALARRMLRRLEDSLPL